MARVVAWMGRLTPPPPPCEMSMTWEPDRRSDFLFSPPAHLCAVTYITEISLHVTLNNQSSPMLFVVLFVWNIYNFSYYMSLLSFPPLPLTYSLQTYEQLNSLRCCIELKRIIFMAFYKIKVRNVTIMKRDYDILLKWIHHFKSDVILYNYNNMDHIRILGASSVILSQTK